MNVIPPSTTPTTMPLSQLPSAQLSPPAVLPVPKSILKVSAPSALTAAQASALNSKRVHFAETKTIQIYYPDSPNSETDEDTNSDIAVLPPDFFALAIAGCWSPAASSSEEEDDDDEVSKSEVSPRSQQELDSTTSNYCLKLLRRLCCRNRKFE